MKVKLSGNRTARVSVKFGNETPAVIKFPERVAGRPFRSVCITLGIFNGEDMSGEPVSVFSGSSYCSPLDQFNKFEGRKRAMMRIMASARNHLSKEDWQILCPVMLRGPMAVC